MDEELVEICHGAHPPDTEESDRRPGPDPSDQPRKVLALSQSGPPPLAEPRERTRQNKAWPGHEIVFSQHEVGGQVVSGPALEEGRNRRPSLLEQIAELTALLRVQRNTSHAVEVYGH